jgi:hypothetical protein
MGVIVMLWFTLLVGSVFVAAGGMVTLVFRNIQHRREKGGS